MLSTQDTAAPKRRSAAANRRRRKRQGAASESQVTGQPTSGQVAGDEPTGQSRAERKAAARAEAVESTDADAPQERHLRRQQERRDAKSRQPERKRGRFVNTERFSGIQGFYHDTAAEIRKVNWPDRETTRNLTIVVMALSVILGLLLGGIDYVLFQMFEAMA